MRILHSVTLLAAAVAIAMTLAAAPLQEREPLRVNKPAATWTDEERAAARYDPVRIAERNEIYFRDHPAEDERGASAMSRPSVSGHIIINVDGRRNPELVMPFEAFEALVGAVDPRRDSRLRLRAKLAPGIRDLGLDVEKLWSDVDEVAGDYAQYRLSDASDRCEARNLAFKAAEAKIGHDTLYRVFYEVIAPQFRGTETTNSPDPAAQLVRAARCQQ